MSDDEQPDQLSDFYERYDKLKRKLGLAESMLDIRTEQRDKLDQELRGKLSAKSRQLEANQRNLGMVMRENRENLEARDGQALAFQKFTENVIGFCVNLLETKACYEDHLDAGVLFSMASRMSKDTARDAQEIEARIREKCWVELAKMVEEQTGGHCCEDCPCGHWNEEVQDRAKLTERKVEGT